MRRFCAFLAVMAALCPPARGDLLRKMLEEGAEALARRTARHADDAARAVARHGDDALRAATRHGDDVLRVTARHGDDAARVLARHEAVAAPVIERLGAPAVEALGAVDPRNGRRMAMMLDAGDFDRLGRSPEVLGVIGKYGDPAMEFVWKHKGSLAVGTAMAAFLANPKPFIDGTRDLAGVVAENGVKPLATGVGGAVQEAARPVVWLLGAACAVWLGLMLLKRR